MKDSGLRYWPICTTRGFCWAKADDQEHACRIVLEFEGRSAGPRPVDREPRSAPPEDCAHLTERGWCYSDGKPYLGLAASFLQAFGATYEEMQEYAAADLECEHGSMRAVCDGIQRRRQTGPYAPKPERKGWGL